MMTDPCLSFALQGVCIQQTRCMKGVCKVYARCCKVYVGVCKVYAPIRQDHETRGLV